MKDIRIFVAWFLSEYTGPVPLSCWQRDIRYSILYSARGKDITPASEKRRSKKTVYETL